MNELGSLIVAGSGEADSYQRDLLRRAFARLSGMPTRPPGLQPQPLPSASRSRRLLADWRQEIGMIAISDQGPAERC